MEEFVSKGFRSASLRTIVKKAGVTTGAFYGYYDSKEELFNALMGDRADEFAGKYEESERTTLGRIRKAAIDEFIKKGYRASSLRNIVKLAGVTTGAFYGYYSSKEALFDELVGRQYREFTRTYKEFQEQFAALPIEEQQRQMENHVWDRSEWMTRYIYENKTVFKLLICGADGTKYENFLDDLVQLKAEAAQKFLDTMHQNGVKTNPVEPELEHLLYNGLFASFFELVIHDIPRENADRYIRQLQEFYMAGWKKIIGI